MADDKEPFLSRWSRRKLETNVDPSAAPLPAGSIAAAPVAPATGTAALPSAPSPPQRSAEYREFFDPQVDEKLRRAALKQLFGDPHFNVMDGLDTYIDDYSVADPIPESMLRQLNQAKELFLVDEEQLKTHSAGDAAATAEDAAALPEGPADPSTPSPGAPSDPMGNSAIVVAATPAPERNSE